MSTRRSMTVVAALAVACQLTVACAGTKNDDRSAPASTTSTPSALTTTASSSTAAGSTTTEFRFEKVAKLPAMDITTAVAFGDAIYAGQRDKDFGPYALFRIDNDGRVTGPVRTREEISVYGLYSTDHRLFVAASERKDGRFICGFATVDPKSLEVGSPDSSLEVHETDGSSSCGTPPLLTDGPIVIAAYYNRLAVLDTSDGKVRTATVDLPKDEYPTSIMSNRDAIFLTYSPTSDGPGLSTSTGIVRVDRESLATTAHKTLEGRISLEGNDIILTKYSTKSDDGTVAVGDPSETFKVDQSTLEAVRVEHGSQTSSVCDRWTSSMTTSDQFQLPTRVGNRFWSPVFGETLDGYTVEGCKRDARVALPDVAGIGRATKELFALGDELYMLVTSAESSKPSSGDTVPSRELFKLVPA